MSRLTALLNPSGDFGDYHWQISTWSKLQEGAKEVRESVFIKEQLVPTDMNLDEYDISAVHILVTKAGEAVATARMIKSERGVSHVGRMGVLFHYRGEGLGRLMLIELMRYANRRRDLFVTLNAQTQTVGFYKKMGYTPEGNIYFEGSIPHIKMRTDLATNHFAASKT